MPEQSDQVMKVVEGVVEKLPKEEVNAIEMQLDVMPRSETTKVALRGREGCHTHERKYLFHLNP